MRSRLKLAWSIVVRLALVLTMFAAARVVTPPHTFHSTQNIAASDSRDLSPRLATDSLDATRRVATLRGSIPVVRTEPPALIHQARPDSLCPQLIAADSGHLTRLKIPSPDSSSPDPA